MDERVLRRIDLNLLVAFVVLVRERNVSRAAERLLIGQPSMSAALARLRELLDDEILVRVGRRLEPTPRALALVEPVEAALESVQSALAERSTFEPDRFEGTLRIGMPDDHELAFLPGLAARLSREAPRASLVAMSADRTNAPALLDAGEIDAAVSTFHKAASWHVREELFRQGYACLFARDRLPEVGAPVSLDDYCRHPHVLVSFRGDRVGTVDKALAALGRAREVPFAVPRFLVVPALLREVAAFASMPEPVARRLAAAHPDLSFSPLPVRVEPRPVSLLWRRRDVGDPAQIWWRALVKSVVAEARVSGGSLP